MMITFGGAESEKSGGSEMPIRISTPAAAGTGTTTENANRTIPKNTFFIFTSLFY